MDLSALAEPEPRQDGQGVELHDPRRTRSRIHRRSCPFKASKQSGAHPPRGRRRRVYIHAER